MAPGWVRTDLGSPQARLSIEESIPNLANTMDAQAGKAGLQSGLPRPEDSMVSTKMRIVAVDEHYTSIIKP
jgi:hypothetical protein